MVICIKKPFCECLMLTYLDFPESAIWIYPAEMTGDFTFWYEFIIHGSFLYYGLVKYVRGVKIESDYIIPFFSIAIGSEII